MTLVERRWIPAFAGTTETGWRVVVKSGKVNRLQITAGAAARLGAGWLFGGISNFATQALRTRRKSADMTARVSNASPRAGVLIFASTADPTATRTLTEVMHVLKFVQETDRVQAKSEK